MQQMLLTCGDDFFPIIIIFIIISIIANALKAAKEKKEREERMRRMQQEGQKPHISSSSRPVTTHTQEKSPASIEDFLRELAGAPPEQREPKPAPRQAEWHAPPRRQEEFLARKRWDEERHLREIELQKQKRREARRKEKLEKERKRQKPLLRAASKSEKVHAVKAEGGYHTIKKDVHEDAYRITKTLPRQSVHLSFNSEELRKAIVFREVLGPPVALRESEEPYSFL